MSLPLLLSPFIAAFGKNNAKRHYQPVTEIDVADKVGALNMTPRHSTRVGNRVINMQKGYKTYLMS